MWNLLKYVWNHPLNAHGKLAALWRVLRWQVASRLMPGLIALPYAQGTSLFATRGMTGATGNWYCGLHEVHEMAFVLHLLRPAEHFVDVGANIGSYTVLAGGAVKARVTAVEPIPATFAHLQRNVALNDMNDRVRCCQVGLSDKPGALRFSSGLDTVNHVLAEGEDLPGVDVPVTRLDDLIGQDVPVLMKIDVEGFEGAVLRGSEDIIRRFKPVLFIELNDDNLLENGDSARSLITHVEQMGYRVLDGSSEEEIKKDHDLAHCQFDILCVPL